jgi:predicted nucleic acid-binding protein
VVLDTNVLLAGFATHGLCEALLKIVYRDHSVILSEHILDEVSRHFSGKFKATKPQTESFDPLARLFMMRYVLK